MDERKTTEATAEPPVQSEGRTMLEQAFARGSGHLNDVPPAAPERTEHSVMEGLPPAKAERVAAMRRELADLQRQLTDAQQRIATELQGRADDAERIEALEATVTGHEAKTHELTAELVKLRAQSEDARRQHQGETHELTAELVKLRAQSEEARRQHQAETEEARRQHQVETEETRRQHQAVTEQLDTQATSLRDANALLATRDTELAAVTSERDTLKTEVATARAKVRDVASQLARLGQELTGTELQPASGEPAPAAAPALAERPKPPPIPSSRATAEPAKVETILEVTEEPKSKLRVGLLLVCGLLVGCIATVAFMKWTSASTAGGQDVGASPSAALVAEPASDRASPSAAEPAAPAEPAAAAEPAARSAFEPSAEQAVAAPDVRPQANDDSAAEPAAPAKPATNGVIVLPEEAADHRVFVDGRVVPVKGSRVVVPCGTREIRIGSRGAPQKLDVACGAETALPAER